MTPKIDILLSGTMRSGTTLMCSALNAHPNINIVSDQLTWFWKRCYNLYGKMDSIYNLEWALYELEPYWLHHLNILDKNTVLEKTIKRGISYISLYYVLIEELLHNPKGNYIGIKSTHASRCYEPFINCVPNPFIIHLVRDPRDVYYSHKIRTCSENIKYKQVIKTYFTYLKNMRNVIGKLIIGKNHLLDDRLLNPYIYKYPLKIFDEWSESNCIAIELSKVYSDHFAIIKYEDFVSDPENTLKKLLYKMGIDWIEDFYRFNNLRDRNKKKFVSNTSYNDKGPNGYYTDHIGKSLLNITNEENEYYIKVSSNIANKFNYT